jgi:hypothetical protein
MKTGGMNPAPAMFIIAIDEGCGDMPAEGIPHFAGADVIRPFELWREHTRVFMQTRARVTAIWGSDCKTAAFMVHLPYGQHCHTRI